MTGAVRSGDPRRMLVAGVGNIFLSDDGFGVEVVRHLTGRPLPDGVEVIDAGIRGLHLAYQLLDGYDVLLLVDAAPHGREPGTVSLLEVDLAALAAERESGANAAGDSVPDAHGMQPAAVLSMLASLGGTVGRVLLLACEPCSVDEGIGLSDAVAGAVPEAVAAVLAFVEAGAVPAEEVRG